MYVATCSKNQNKINVRISIGSKTFGIHTYSERFPSNMQDLSPMFDYCSDAWMSLVETKPLENNLSVQRALQRATLTVNLI